MLPRRIGETISCACKSLSDVKIDQQSTHKNLPSGKWADFGKLQKNCIVKVVLLVFNFKKPDFFLLTANLGLVLLIICTVFSHRVICRPSGLRPLCGEALGRDSNPGRADLVTGTLTTRNNFYPFPHIIYAMLRAKNKSTKGQL